MPVTESVTERNLGVPRSYASFAVPLGATTKMDGCASIYPAISAIFVAQFFGLDLSVTDYLLIAFVSVIGSAATAGVTGATVMLTLTLSTLGLPLEGVGPAARHRPDPRHGPHRGQRRGPGAGPDHRRQARGHPRPGDVRRPARARRLARGRGHPGAGSRRCLTTARFPTRVPRRPLGTRVERYWDTDRAQPPWRNG